MSKSSCAEERLSMDHFGAARNRFHGRQEQPEFRVFTLNSSAAVGHFAIFIGFAHDWRVIERICENLGQLRWRGFVILLAVATIVAGLLTFIILTEKIRGEEPHGLESQLMLALRNPQDPHQLLGPAWLEKVSVNLTALGSVSVLILLTLLITGYLLVARKLHAATLLISAAVGGAGLSYLLKFLVGRDRPQVVPHLAEISDPSYPSGHTMLSTVIFLTLAVILAQTVESRRSKIYLIVAALFLALVVGVTRVLIGVHYPTDVLAGWAAGTVWALGCWLLAEWLRDRGVRP